MRLLILFLFVTGFLVLRFGVVPHDNYVFDCDNIPQTTINTIACGG
ncbi:hypothetical protein Syn7803US13_64 [Synechococcus phage ACG-2014f]|uniref:Uncharacterized protein n=5 Tax=Atlauavirus TaxID=2733092 RepID=A0A0E3G5Y2_9CAUD|nr:hypothetical protein AAJ63_gp069 [Synechococcus phage ACG-2014f]YP_009778220.1 hypothetical protein HOQ61_gp066 [Synechococcus phage ACG-2014f_Syn7803C7]YP_009778506.1 hypothetical protein HOQ62_gp066 [Synechococcus phage ACG-2014f_Syn7803C8]YP_009778791.1 hypothetical protein HOQ63_gp064 [Synechococcus phage ACG-2014f_Syn7803US26]AIX16592.1 hypothetical protein Syn7803C58_67 [Synechococcus phage ACG-2014f]AIX18366.1 hypothetical protein Syn7803C6_67 [Synechococcus phage ACG-2014f]AIX19957